MEKYLVESALLMHGLKSVTEEELIQFWLGRNIPVVWMEGGTIQIGNIPEFCPFRAKGASLPRINGQNFDQAVQGGWSGALTASGTMKACETFGIRLAVTCGIGGLMQGQEEDACHDIHALKNSTVSLIATSPKDMFDIQTTIDAILKNKIAVLGKESNVCDGYLFSGEQVLLSGTWKGDKLTEKTLYLRGIPKEDRIQDKKILEQAVEEGRKAERRGAYFHPTVNAWIDRCSHGISSRIQLESLDANIQWAEELV